MRLQRSNSCHISRKWCRLNDTQVSREWTVGKVAHKIGTGVETVYCRCMNNLYTVECPALSEMETTTDLDRAMDICFAMHDESNSYACIRDSFGDVVGEYGDVCQGIADMLF